MSRYYDYRDYEALRQRSDIDEEFLRHHGDVDDESLRPNPLEGFTLGQVVKGLLLIEGLVPVAIFFRAYWIALTS